MDAIDKYNALVELINELREFLRNQDAVDAYENAVLICHAFAMKGVLEKEDLGF